MGNSSDFELGTLAMIKDGGWGGARGRTRGRHQPLGAQLQKCSPWSWSSQPLILCWEARLKKQPFLEGFQEARGVSFSNVNKIKAPAVGLGEVPRVGM